MILNGPVITKLTSNYPTLLQKFCKLGCLFLLLLCCKCSLDDQSLVGMSGVTTLSGDQTKIEWEIQGVGKRAEGFGPIITYRWTIRGSDEETPWVGVVIVPEDESGSEDDVKRFMSKAISTMKSEDDARKMPKLPGN